MTIEDELRTLINKRYGSVNRFAQVCGISQSTLFTTLSRGITKANVQTIITICRKLQISTDDLCQGRITPLQFLNPNMEYINLNDLNEENQKRLKDYYELLKRSQNG